MRLYLKKLGFNKYYEHIPFLLTSICGKPPIVIPGHIEHKLKRMFDQIQEPFEKTKPKNRKNFLSYSYVIHKFCQLLGLTEYLYLFPLLKSSEKLRAQDLMWKNICHELQWEYMPSI
ncbi:hypothetical protein HK102_009833 [Quaeritorhiza haematococci]|nr:hypothetical protein HK102_009833 [Quaeritorhiza haematococci]